MDSSWVELEIIPFDGVLSVPDLKLWRRNIDSAVFQVCAPPGGFHWQQRDRRQTYDEPGAV